MRKLRSKRLAAGVAAIIPVTAAGGVAYAGTRSPTERPEQAGRVVPLRPFAPRMLLRRLRRAVLRVSAAYIGISPADLRAELAGHSLAEVAEAHGKTGQGLTETLMADAKVHLDRAVANGRITQERADELLEQAPGRVAQLVRHVFPARPVPATV